jgi:hypothetical protein
MRSEQPSFLLMAPATTQEGEGQRDLCEAVEKDRKVERSIGVSWKAVELIVGCHEHHQKADTAKDDRDENLEAGQPTRGAIATSTSCFDERHTKHLAVP